MMYKNTIKLLFSKFSLVWKLLVYFALATAIASFVAILCARPIYGALVDGGFVTLIQNTYTSFVNNLNLAQLTLDITAIGDLFIKILFVDNLASLLIFIILFLFAVFVLGSFLRGFYMMACCNSLNLYMSSMVDQKFLPAMWENFSKNVIYNLMYLITALPLKLAIYVICFFELKISGFGYGWVLFAPLLAIFTYTILNAFRITIFAGWVPSVITLNISVGQGLITGFRIIRRRFARVFSGAIGIVLTIIFANVFVGIFTFGVAWLITIPACFLMTATYNMVTFYSCQGLRFYVDPYNIIAPKRREFTENFDALKEII